MIKKFIGTYAVVVTPFLENGDFDIPSAKAHIDWLIEKGIHGLCILGATGEYQSITNEEHKAYVKEIVPYVNHRIPVIVGVSRERPDDVVELMENARECGADACMALSPFYCHPAQDEIVAFYQYLSDHTEMPFVVYNNPGSAGVDIAPETYKKLLTIPRAALVKESTGQIQRLTEVVNEAPDSVSVFCGCDSLAFESFAAGACGWISMAANFAPVDCAELFQAVFQEKEYEKARAIYKRILPLLNLLESFPKPVQANKYILKKYCGIESGFVRRPRLELNQEEKDYIDSIAGAIQFQ